MRGLLFCLVVSAVSCSQPAAREMSEGALETPVTGDSLLISATAALQNGQPWRAAQILEPVLRDSAQRTPERVILAARAAAEWGGWSQVDRLLRRIRGPVVRQRKGWQVQSRREAATARRDTVSRPARLAVNQGATPGRGVRVVLPSCARRIDSLDRAGAAYAKTRHSDGCRGLLRLRAAR